MNEKYFENKCRIAIALSDFGDFDRESRTIDIVNLLKRIAKDQREACAKAVIIEFEKMQKFSGWRDKIQTASMNAEIEKC